MTVSVLMLTTVQIRPILRPNRNTDKDTWHVVHRRKSDTPCEHAELASSISKKVLWVQRSSAVMILAHFASIMMHAKAKEIHMKRLAPLKT
jgi:hypothetical protein